MKKKLTTLILTILFLGTCIIPSLSGVKQNIIKSKYCNEKTNDYFLPPAELWNKTYGGSEYDYDIGSCVQQTKDNGYIIAGGSSPPGLVHYSLLIKTDDNGVEQWNKSYGELPGYFASSVYQTNDGGYILTGNIYQNESIFADVFLCKTDSNGTEEWTKIFNVSDDDNGNCVKQTSDGGFILTGSSILFKEYEPLNAYGWLIKTDSNGNIKWNYTGPSLSFSYSVKETNDGGFILTGGLSDSFSSENCDILLIKLDNNGTFFWEKTFGENGYEYGLSVLQTSDQGYIITGPSEDIETGDSQICLIKTDNIGNQMWRQEFGGDDFDIGYSIDQTNDGGYIIAGWTNSFGLGSDGWLIKIDEDGNLMWDKTFGPHGSFYSVEQNKEGGYIIVGQTEYYGPPKGNVWLIKVAPDYEYQPNLHCSCKFNWSDIKPGITFTDFFNVQNIGGSLSLLDWKIESYPEWGTWTFTPSDYNDLKPGDGNNTVKIEITTPNEILKTFNGTIKIVSKHDSSDNCTISVSLTTPKTKAISFNPYFLRLFYRFPFFVKILNQII
jgi:hypothetical protein